MQPIPLKIAYIGGSSRDWARKLMLDLALCPDLTGEVALSAGYNLAFQAFHNDPNNHLTLDDSWELFNKMLRASREFLPARAEKE